MTTSQAEALESELQAARAEASILQKQLKTAIEDLERLRAQLEEEREVAARAEVRMRWRLVATKDDLPAKLSSREALSVELLNHL